ncbi:MAG: hypothetical protein HDR05_14680 [Lachnospiraceae bacterium]|nr:hypothetical protein [Lachnospiraceae bacterium]
MVFILFFISIIVAFIVGLFYGLKLSSNETIHMKQRSDKYLDQLKLAVRWIKDPSKITDYIIKHKYKKVCIYGMSYFGDCLGEYLYRNGIEVVCGIDRNSEHVYSSLIPIYNVHDSIPEADVVIVTAIISYPEVRKVLNEKMRTDVVSLEDILYE